MLDFRTSRIHYDRAIFLDRDGTINADAGYTHKLADLDFMPGSLEGLRLLSTLDAHIIIVTNQSGVALGKYTIDSMSMFNRFMVDQIHDQGGRIDAVYCSPYQDSNTLQNSFYLHRCTKPNPGMLEEACNDFNLRPQACWMIGDKLTDIQAGNRIGASAILVGKQDDCQTPLSTAISCEQQPLISVNDLYEAADYILYNWHR